MERKSCYLFHRWGKWSEFTVVGEITVLMGKEVKIPFSENRQKRTCERCGYIQDHYVS